MEFEGKVVQLLAPVSGTSARGQWTKQEVVLEQPGEFGRKVCVSFWGDKAQDAANLKPGESITVSVNLESREYNGRWYTEVRAWKVSRGTSQAPAGDMAPPMDAFAPVDSGEGMGSSSSADSFDDLPF